jgi:hypothetical protein
VGRILSTARPADVQRWVRSWLTDAERRRPATLGKKLPDREREGSQVTYDWVTLVHGKIDALKPAMAPMIGK